MMRLLPRVGILALGLGLMGCGASEQTEPEPVVDPIETETVQPEEASSSETVPAGPASDPQSVPSDDPDFDPYDGWQPCGGSAGCEHVATISAPHGGPVLQVFYDPDRRDAITRWGDMLAAVMGCVEQGGTLTQCVSSADAPDLCKTEYDRIVGLSDEATAFEVVFLTQGSPCRPVEGQP